MEKTVVLGVSSGIAAYKCLDLITLLKKQGVHVEVIMTKNAAQMIPKDKFEKVSGNKVHVELFEAGFDYKKVLKDRKVDHIALADSADVLVLAPATANLMAKLANGFADDFLTTTALAATCPVIICPSMNVNMWNNPAVCENVSVLKRRGFVIVGPDSGMLACGYEGVGRLADVETIRDEILRQLSYTTELSGKKVIVTAGGTQEKVDDMRFITNRSSGKMGAALADECYLRGADVLLLRAKSAMEPRYFVKQETFTTADDLEKFIGKSIKDADVLIHCAAVGDFELDKPIKGKVSSKEKLTIYLKPRVKILNTVKKLNPKVFLIAFKAEYNLSENELIKKARKQILESGVDLVVANDVSFSDQGFEADINKVIIVSKNAQKKVPLASKRDIAKTIVDFFSDVILGNHVHVN